MPFPLPSDNPFLSRFAHLHFITLFKRKIPARVPQALRIPLHLPLTRAQSFGLWSPSDGSTPQSTCSSLIILEPVDIFIVCWIIGIWGRVVGVVPGWSRLGVIFWIIFGPLVGSSKDHCERQIFGDKLIGDRRNGHKT